MKKANGMSSAVIAEIAKSNELRMTVNRTSVLRRIALVVSVRFYKEHRDEIGGNMASSREDLVVCFMKGFSVSECYERCLGFKAENESMFGKVRIGKGRRSSRVKGSGRWKSARGEVAKLKRVA